MFKYNPGFRMKKNRKHSERILRLLCHFRSFECLQIYSTPYDFWKFVRIWIDLKRFVRVENRKHSNSVVSFQFDVKPGPKTGYVSAGE